MNTTRPLPRLSAFPDSTPALAVGCALMVGVFLLSAASVFLFAWVLMLVLGAVGVGWGYWLCLGVTFLFMALVGAVTSR